MKFTRSEIPDIVIIEPNLHKDERGYFFESYRDSELNKFLGYNINFCQENESKSKFGVLRGLHYQIEPFAQSKLVRVIKGKVLDVALDIRINSPTFGKHIAVELSEENKLQLFIPKGFAHGFVVLSNTAILSYKVDNYYNPNSERVILYNDKSLKIDWKINESLIKVSEKDKNPK
jgi:dTDP-4-dehydrorhamnose 3,5-epimerase